jgi:hypothetical protein
MDLAASGGFLFLFGDSSTDVITNVQLSGDGTVTSPFTTQFSYSNVDPQVGHGFPRPVGHWGRFFVHCNGVFANPVTTEFDPLAHRGGIYLMTGGDAQIISEKATNIWNTVDTSNYYPTLAPATMFGFRVMLLNGRFTDPFGRTRSLLLMWHGPTSKGEQFWSVAAQNLELTNIGYYEQNSVITPFGTDGTHLYQLFAKPDPTLIKRFSSKTLRGVRDPAHLTIKDWKRLFIELHDVFGGGVSITGTVTTSGGGIPNGSQDVGFMLTEGKIYDTIPWPLNCAGIGANIDLQSYAPDFIIERLHLCGEERTLYGA